MTEPTDAELLAEWDRVSHIADAGQRRLACLRAVLAKWGTPPAVAGEPVAWYVTGCGRLLDEDEAKAEARHIGGTARAIPLYTAPQPSTTPQADSVLEDAARESEYRRGYRHGYEQRDAEVRGALA